MMPPFETLDEIARCAAGRYKRRGSRADFEDMRQEAWVAILMARRSFDVSRGTKFEGYAWSAAVRWLRGYLWKSGAPVSASDHYVLDLRGLTTQEPTEDLLDPIETPEQHAIEDERRARIRGAAQRALGPMGEDLLPAMLVVSGLAAPSELTPEGRKERWRLYRQLCEARIRLACSRELWHLWREESHAGT